MDRSSLQARMVESDGVEKTDRARVLDRTSLGCKLRTLHQVCHDHTANDDDAVLHGTLDLVEVQTDLNKMKSQLLSITT